MRLIALIVMALLLAGTSMAQSKRKKKREEVQNNPTSLDPSYNKKYQEPRQAKRPSRKGPTYNAEKIYYERMDALAKDMRKNEKMMEKPQYSDPSYFGHKRPPKRHKAGKLKYCKECGIRH